MRSRSPCLLLAVVAFVAVVVGLPGSSTKRPRNSPPPLIGTEHGRPKVKRQAECHFGGKTYELQDTWHPDLGPPFGTQFCVRCECVRIQKKRRVVGKVHCRNFMSECSSPMCEEPVLLPGQCCKSCPENPDEARDLSNYLESFESDNKQSNEYVALLTGLSMNPPVSTSVVGNGRFVFSKRNVYYSIYLGRNERLSYVRFVDEGGTILEEQEVDMDGQRAKSGKICGVWRRIPKIYRKLLREEKMFVELVSDTNSEGVVRGRLARYHSLNKESFSALLRTPPGYPSVEGAGGLAIISTWSTTASAIHMHIIFNGIVNERDPEVMTLELWKSASDRASEKPLERGSAILQLPNKTYNAIEWKMEMLPSALRSLLSGKPVLSLVSKHRPDYRLEGPIIPKSTCNVFQAVLSSSNSLLENQPTLQAAGLALITINDDTTLNYSVYLHGLSSRIRALSLATQHKKRRQIIDTNPGLNNSWANGTSIKTSPRDIEMLLSDEFFLDVDTERYESELRGHVTHRLYNEAHASNAPILLTGIDDADESSAVGQAWIHVDRSCKLAFDVVIVGLGNPRSKDRSTPAPTYLLKIVESTSNNAHAEKRLVAEFSGNEIEDVVEDLSKLTLARLDSGVTYLQVTRNATLGTTENESVLLRGRINNVRVPMSCLPSSDNSNDEGSNAIGMETYKCFYEGRLFEDGSQWTAEHDSCMMCSCQRARVVCEPVICPRPHCNDAVLLSGECCLSCPDVLVDQKDNMSRGCYFDGDKKWHQAGTIWHPYVPPFGFSLCAVCKCDARTLTVSCDKVTCKPLPCDERYAVRANPQDCCKKCAASPSVNTVISVRSGEYFQDEGSTRNNTDVLAEGGCEFHNKMYENGEEWHPRLQRYGEEKCILCNCKDGVAKCRRLKCPELTCSNRIEVYDQCCQRCADDNTQNTSVRYRHKSFASPKKRRKMKQPGA